MGERMLREFVDHFRKENVVLLTTEFLKIIRSNYVGSNLGIENM